MPALWREWTNTIPFGEICPQPFCVVLNSRRHATGHKNPFVWLFINALQKGCSVSRKPYSNFFWSDYRGDPKLRLCSFAARGLWMEILAIMHEATPRGFLTIEGIAPNDQQLAVLTGGLLSEVKKLKKELLDSGVPSIEENGIWYSRRMVREDKKSDANKKSGALGGNPKLTTHYNAPGHIYLIRRQSDNAIKIGISNSPAKRLYRIKQQYPGDVLHILDSAFVHNMGAEESYLHKMFPDKKNGEWFLLNNEQEKLLFEKIVHLKVNGKGENESSPSGFTLSPNGSGSSTSQEEERGKRGTEVDRGAVAKSTIGNCEIDEPDENLFGEDVA